MNIPLFQISFVGAIIENEAKPVGGYSGLLFELGIPLNDPVRARKFSKPRNSSDFNFCQTEMLGVSENSACTFHIRWNEFVKFQGQLK